MINDDDDDDQRRVDIIDQRELWSIRQVTHLLDCQSRALTAEPPRPIAFYKGSPDGTGR